MTSTTTNEEQLKALLSLVPPFMSPARVWVAKIKLLWPTAKSEPPQLSQVVLQRLPPHLFDQVAEKTFASAQDLLEDVLKLESPTAEDMARTIFTAPASIPPGQLPSTVFHELRRATKLALPTAGKEADAIAWGKLQSAFPTSIQHILLATGASTPSEATLNLVDKAWRQVQGDQSNVAALHVDTPTNSTRGSELTSRLESLEAAVRSITQKAPQEKPTSAAVCWYHAKFGAQARRCFPPCKFHVSPKERGAPSP